MFDAPSSQVVGQKPYHIVIVGAGITGLSLGWFLKKKHGSRIKITILEKTARPGGWIKTINHEGFLFECGPRGCRPSGNGQTTIELVHQLGLEDQLCCNDPKAFQRYLYFNGKLNHLPGLWMAKMAFPLLTEWLKPRGTDPDESISQFFTRRFGEEITRLLVDPMVSGIYAGDIDKLSIKSCFTMLHQMEKEKGSITRGLLFSKKNKAEKMAGVSLFSFKEGMETLPKALYSQLKDDLIFNCEVKRVVPKNSGVMIELKDKVIHADHLFSTVAESIVDHPRLKQLMRSIPRASLVMVNCGFKNSVLKQKGFGYLIPSMEREKLLGMVWDSSVFPEQNRKPDETRLTMMLGGDRHPELVDSSDKIIEKIGMEALKLHTGIEQMPDTFLIQRIKGAFPQYYVGHQTKIEEIEREVRSLSPHITLAGTSFNSLAVNDCIHSSFLAANSFELSKPKHVECGGLSHTHQPNINSDCK